MSIDADAIKQAHRAMWATGDFSEIARSIVAPSELLVERTGAGGGDVVLDVATGSGNAAIIAAERGATVTGLDITPELLEVARERALEAGLEATFIEGDAEQLPFADASFDHVTSCFGVMFAPRQQQAAAELVRVTRPGGSIAVAAWTPEGLMGQMFRTNASYMPPPPPELVAPVMWGVEDHVRGLFAGAGVELEFERATVAFVHDSAESWVAHNERLLGPMILAKQALEPQGKWPALRAELVELYEAANEARDGSLRAPGEFLVTVVRVLA